MKNQTLDILIVIPAYNEENTIGKVINQIKNTPYNFIVIDDGSTDNTLSIIRNNTTKSQYLFYPTNMGKGYAIRTGSNWAKMHKYSYILVLDADGQNSIANIELFDLALQKHPTAQIIIGNRMHNPKNMPFIRFLTNKVMSAIISKLSKHNIKDSQCGMRLASVEIFDKLKANRFDLESEMLLKTKGSIINIPIKSVYSKNRISKIKPISDTIRFIKLLWRYYGKKT